VGHWSEGLVEELAALVGGNPDRDGLRRLLLEAGHEIETLAGRSYHPVRRATAVVQTNGLPFIDVPDMHIGSLESTDAVWSIPDPVNPQMAAVMQVLPLDIPQPTAAPIADGLGFAGQLLGQAVRHGMLSREFVIEWLGTFVGHEERMELFRRVMDPATRFTIPVLGQAVGGWWIQVSRRLLWVTDDTENEGRLIEPLIDEPLNGKLIPLAAAEAVLIIAPMTGQPVDWAFAARIWPEGARRPISRPWNILAPAIHGHGIPIITVDGKSTPYEIACQVVLKAFWHGYLGGGERALANVIALAYPRQVDLILRKTNALDRASAAATLLEHLVHPGFDPAQGADATRRYVWRKASIIVMDHRKQESPERYPWTQIGITERHYYKLLPKFAEKVNGRYDIDYDTIVKRMKDHLNGKDRSRDDRAVLLEFLQERGFSRDAARKWLQRHPPEQALHAWPRGSRPVPGDKTAKWAG
jgi:hypothetical protein